MLEKFINDGFLPTGSFLVDEHEYRNLCLPKSKLLGFYGFPISALEILSLPHLDHKTSNPNLKLSVSDAGKLTVTAILKWGKKNFRTILESPPHKSYQEAISDVYNLSRTIKNEVICNPWKTLNDLLTVKRKHAPPNLKNVNDIGIPSYEASVCIKSETYVSFPCDSKMEALQSLASILDNIPDLVKERRSSTPSKPQMKKRAKQAAKKKTAKNQLASNKKIMQMINASVIRWRCEHGWLLDYKYKTKKEVVRVHELSLFLAMTDRLRRHEVSTVMRNNLAPKMEAEIIIIAQRMTKNGEKKHLANYLSYLIKSDVLLPSTNVTVDSEFIEKSYRNGDDPKEITDKLLQYGYIRQNIDEKILLTNKGIELVESELGSGLNYNSLGNRLSSNLLFSLSKITAVTTD